MPLAAAPSRYRFVALALIMAVQTASNLGALGLPALAPLLREDLGLSRQEAGSFLSAFYVGGALTSFRRAGWPTVSACGGRSWPDRDSSGSGSRS